MDRNHSVKWQAISGFDLLWRCWDCEYIVYHTGTGDTHLLNHLAATTLQTLQHTPSTLAELTRQAESLLPDISDQDTPDDEELNQSMTQLLTDLSRLGLVEQVDA